MRALKGIEGLHLTVNSGGYIDPSFFSKEWSLSTHISESGIPKYDALKDKYQPSDRQRHWAENKEKVKQAQKMGMRRSVLSVCEAILEEKRRAKVKREHFRSQQHGDGTGNSEIPFEMLVRADRQRKSESTNNEKGASTAGSSNLPLDPQGSSTQQQSPQSPGSGKLSKAIDRFVVVSPTRIKAASVSSPIAMERSEVLSELQDEGIEMETVEETMTVDEILSTADPTSVFACELRVLKCIRLRERSRNQLFEVCEHVQNLYNDHVAEQDANDSNPYARRDMKKSIFAVPPSTAGSLSNILFTYRLTTLSTVATIQEWRAAWNDDQKPFEWEGENYMLKMMDDLASLQENEPFMKWIRVPAAGNPFLIPSETYEFRSSGDDFLNRLVTGVATDVALMQETEPEEAFIPDAKPKPTTIDQPLRFKSSTENSPYRDMGMSRKDTISVFGVKKQGRAEPRPSLGDAIKSPVGVSPGVDSKIQRGLHMQLFKFKEAMVLLLEEQEISQKANEGGENEEGESAHADGESDKSPTLSMKDRILQRMSSGSAEPSPERPSKSRNVSNRSSTRGVKIPKSGRTLSRGSSVGSRKSSRSQR